jgi:hypothetical protein
VSLESANLALARVYGFLPRADEEPASSMDRRGRHTGQHTGTAPLRHRETSLSWRWWRTAPRKTDGDVAAGPPPCRTSLESRAIPATGTRKVKAGEGDRRRNDTMINKHPSPMKGQGQVCSNEEQFLSPFNLQSNFVSCFSPSTVIQI